MSLGQGNLLNNRYRLVEILGRGGMGAVYRAVDESLGVDVAVKENLFTTEDYARQFRMEAVILAGMRHPNLPRVTDHFVLDGQGQYLVMDYIEGDDLRQYIERKGTLSELEAIRIGAAVCDALAYLHSRKPPILHRDIKLGNVKITPEGGVILVDFGLAKMAWEHEETMTGARAMTPGYSPPEQYGSARTDARSDIYSLGATLYAAITGVVPEDSLMRAVDGLSLTPVRKHKPSISNRLEAVLERAMEPVPANRYQSAEDFKAALLGQEPAAPAPVAAVPVAETAEPLAVAQPPVASLEPVVAPAPRRKSSFGRIFGLFILLLLIVLGAIFLNPSNQPVLQKYIQPILAYIFTPTPAPTLAPTATLPLPQTPRVTFTSTTAPTRVQTKTPVPTATKKVLPTATPTVVLPTDTPIPPVETPAALGLGGGSGQIAYALLQNKTAQIYLANTDGSNIQQLTNDPNGACNFDWSPDGKKIVYVSPCAGKDPEYPDSGLHIFDLETGSTTQLLDGSQGEFDPVWSPDGTRIAFTSLRSGGFQIELFDLETKVGTSLTDASENTQSRYPAWSSDGRQLVYVQQKFDMLQVWTMNADGSNKTRLVFDGDNVAAFLPAWSPDGTYVLFSETGKDLVAPKILMRFNLGMQQAERFKPLEGLPIIDVDFSPDGEWIAYESSDGSNPDIYLFNMLDFQVMRLTTDPGTDFDPVWRP